MTIRVERTWDGKTIGEEDVVTFAVNRWEEEVVVKVTAPSTAIRHRKGLPEVWTDSGHSRWWSFFLWGNRGPTSRWNSAPMVTIWYFFSRIGGRLRGSMRLLHTTLK